MLSLHVSHARIVCAEKNSNLHIVSAAHLETIFEARSDLAATFFGVLAFELATRLNLALLQFARTQRRDELSADPKSGRHVRHITPSRPQDSNKETNFRYDADIHAVKAVMCKRIPKKEKKDPRDAILYMFATRVAVLYQKGHHQKRTEIPLGSLLNVLIHNETDLTLEFLEKKDHKTVNLKLSSVASAKSVTEFLAKLRASFQGQVRPIPSLAMTTGRAMFNFAPGDPTSQISLVMGRDYTVLDRSGAWLYGFDQTTPENRGLFPLSYVDLRPYGVLTGGVMTPADWEEIDCFETMNLSRGNVLIREGDPAQAGHLFFFQTGKFAVEKVSVSSTDGNAVKINSVGAGESVGELLFLLGGCPRASVVCDSDNATVKKLSRDSLSKLLEKAPFAARFWKYLCAMLESRLVHIQLRLTQSVPIVPPAVKLVIPKDQEEAARPAPPSTLPTDLPSAEKVPYEEGVVPAAAREIEISQLINSLADLVSSSEGDEEYME